MTSRCVHEVAASGEPKWPRAGKIYNNWPLADGARAMSCLV